MWGAGWTYGEYSAGQNEGPEAVSGLLAFIPPPKGSGCSRSGYKYGLESATQMRKHRYCETGRTYVGGPVHDVCRSEGENCLMGLVDKASQAYQRDNAPRLLAFKKEPGEAGQKRKRHKMVDLVHVFDGGR